MRVRAPQGLPTNRDGVMATWLALTQQFKVQILVPMSERFHSQVGKAADCKSVIIRSNRIGTSIRSDSLIGKAPPCYGGGASSALERSSRSHSAICTDDGMADIPESDSGAGKA